MEIDQNSPAFLAALRDFHRARQRAVLENIMAHLTGKSAHLLSYDEVRPMLKAEKSVRRGLQEIPLDAIVGSVGRYADFTRSFLPRSEDDAQRWARVKAMTTDPDQIPPITVYQVDRVYFVLDGNHRVSVARQLGATHIPAYVTEIETHVPLSPDIQPDELICKAGYANFLERTRLDELRPGADLSVTAPGQYRLLEEQIEVHHHWLSRQRGRQVSEQEAVTHWYDEVYGPVIQLIRERGILRHFPGRTETDLYVWVSQHQAELKQALGWEVGSEAVANDLAAHFSPQSHPLLERVKDKIRHALIPESLAAGPPPGQWRQEQLPSHHTRRLFIDTLCLVPLREEGADWRAAEQALVVAQREQGRVHGLHVAPPAPPKNARQLQALQAEFKQRCQAAKLQGELSLETGNVTRKLCDRARWIDLVVVTLVQPPPPQPLARLSSEFGTLVRSCPRPVLAVPGPWSPLSRALLAYDGSPKANEALFVAAYLAGQWQIPLVVVTVVEKGHVRPETLAQAQTYLAAREIQAAFVQAQGAIARAIIRTAMLYESDLIIMGGYGFNPMLEVVLGSEVDEILRARRWPVLICR